jgi:hypothetical protein
MADVWNNYQIGLRATEAADYIEELEYRIKLALMLNYANYPGFVDWALCGEKIPKEILTYTKEICDEENYDVGLRLEIEDA